MGRATTSGYGMAATVTAASADCRWSTIACISMPTAVSAARDVTPSSTTAEAMLTPAVAIAPVRPWAYAQEDPVVEIARPIKTAGCAAVRCIVVVAV
jgi:hypothetical protein